MTSNCLKISYISGWLGSAQWCELGWIGLDILR